MFLDLRQIPDGTALEADLCIVGAGAAGITIARQFIGRPITVTVVESGGLEPDEATQALYQGAIVGQPYFDLDVTRLRYFGGSTNHWGGWCAPLHDIDFEARDWVPHSGWPIARYDLEFLLCRRPATRRDRAADLRPDGLAGRQAPLPCVPTGTHGHADPATFGAATHFGERYRDDLAKADNVRVLLNANTLGIDSNAAATDASGLRAGGTFRRARQRARQSHRRRLRRARSCARVLLLSNDVVSGGLGNQHDLVGRFFMEHPHILTGSLFATDTGSWHHGLSERFVKNGTLIQPVIATSPIAQREQGMLGYSANFETSVDQSAAIPPTGIFAIPS